jgi:hypothetical protein
VSALAIVAAPNPQYLLIPPHIDMTLPAFKALPHYKNYTGCAWGVWPADDELGTVNLLTEDVVLRAAKEEIRCVVVVY